MNTENLNNELSATLNLAQQSAYSLLRASADKETDIYDILHQSFGSSYDKQLAEELIQKWRQGNFDSLPMVNIQDLDQLNSAKGAFASSSQTIYISDRYLTQAQESGDITGLVGVLLEEIGHFVDDLINPVDTIGDEGDIFSSLVRGVSLDEDRLSDLRLENDHAVLNLESEAIAVEMSQIAQAVFNGRLYQSHQGNDNRIYTRYSLNSTGTAWSAWDEDGGITYSAPDLEVFNGRLYQAHRGTNNLIYLRYSTNSLATNWSGWRQFGGATLSSPTLEVFNNRLFMSVRGTDNNVYTRYSTDSLATQWSAWDNDGGLTLNAPDLEAFNGRLYQAHRGTNNLIYLRYSTNSLATNWSSWRQFGDITLSAPTLEVFNNRLFMSHRGTDNNIYTRYSTDALATQWSTWDNDGGLTPSAPHLQVFNNRLVQSVQGTDDRIYSRSSIDLLATSWSGWQEFGGFTPRGADDTPMAPPPPPPPPPGKPDINIQISTPQGGFTSNQLSAIQTAVDNWGRIITRDKDSGGVLKLALTSGSTPVLQSGQWNGNWGIAYLDPTAHARNNINSSIVDLGADYHNRIQFNSLVMGGLTRNQLIRLAMHEIGHTLGLDDVQYDASLGWDGIMDPNGLDAKITPGIYQKLESLGYQVNRSAVVLWS